MRRFASLAPYFVEGTKIMLFIFLVMAALIFTVHALITLTVPFSLDYGEGPLLDQAVRIAEGQPLYPPDISTPPYTITNYPPLYALVLSVFQGGEPSLTAGRFISLLATLASALFLALIVYHISRQRVAAISTAVIFLIVPYVLQWSGLVRVDMLALALSTAALYVVVRWPASRWPVIAAALLLVAAVYTRQSYGLAAPLAAFVWLWTHERQQAITLAAVFAGVGLLLFILLNIVTGGGFFFHIITANANEFTFSNLSNWLQDLGRVAPFTLLLGLLFLILAPWRKQTLWPLLVPYLIGTVISALTIGKIGSNVNYFLELSAALSLVAGIFIYWSNERPWWQACLLLALVLQLGLFIQETLSNPVSNLSFRRRDERAIEEIAEIIAQTDGPVLADEYMALIPLENRPLYMQPFEFTQLARDGQWDQEALLQSIRNQEFPLILIYQNPGFSYQVHEDRWTPEMLAAIDEFYTPAQVLAGNTIYQPSGGAGVSTTFAPTQNPTFAPENLEIGDAVMVSTAPAFSQIDIDVNPNNPDHLAAAVMHIADSACTAPDCATTVTYHVSLDGGATWQELDAFAAGQQPLALGHVLFGHDDTLYALVSRNGQLLINKATGAPYEMDAPAAVIIRTSRYPEPDIAITPDDSQLILSYVGRINTNIGISLNRSTDQGQNWSSSTQIESLVPFDDLNAGRATAPSNAQTLIGPDSMAVVWVWDTGFYQWPLGVWRAISTDGGESFGEVRKIAETSGPVDAASQDGNYYVLYRTGRDAEQQLAVATSTDGGETWQGSVVSGDIALSYGFSQMPGISVAPDGTLDVAFYAPVPGAADCGTIGPDRWVDMLFANEGIFDSCPYNVYYTYSRDGGQTFSAPTQINDAPIQADKGQFFGTVLAVTSADEYAYIIWNDSLGSDELQTVTTRINR